MQLISLQNKLQIESDRTPWLCGTCNYYTECRIREDDDSGLFSQQYKYCHEVRMEKSYIPDDELIFIETSVEADWECDCDENFTHKFEIEICPVCGVKFDDPTE